MAADGRPPRRCRSSRARQPPRAHADGRAARHRACWLFLGYAVLIVFALIYLYPFLIQVATSFKTDADADAQPAVADPGPVHHAALRAARRDRLPAVVRQLRRGDACFVTVGRVFFDSLAGYALARIRFRGRAAVFTAILAVMAVPGVVLLIPKFLVLNQLGMYDTYPALVVPLLADAAGVFIMKQFFESIPVGVEEAARIDGAGTFRMFWSVVLPMARPALITLTILSFQGSWNELPHFIVAVAGPGALHADQGRRDADQRPARARATSSRSRWPRRCS